MMSDLDLFLGKRSGLFSDNFAVFPKIEFCALHLGCSAGDFRGAFERRFHTGGETFRD